VYYTWSRASASASLLTTSCESFANSSRPALRRHKDAEMRRERERERERERGRGSDSTECNDAEEARADFRVIGRIEPGRRVVLLEPAATIING